MPSTSFLPHINRHKVLVCMLLGALVGAVAGLRCLDPQFIAGTGGKWIRPENDFVAYLVAWNYFVVDSWRFPLFDLPAMGYPEGGSVLFNDALPLTAVPTKIVYQLLGVRVNPFGWWIFLTYVLQGAFAARVVCALGVPSVWAGTAAAVFAVVNLPFMTRMGHVALSGHFVLLWAIALHFESLRRGRAKTIELGALLAVTLLVNAYLFAMVFAFELATLLALRLRGVLRPRDVRDAALGVAASVVLGLVAGYGMFLTDPSTMKSEGFGLYSWNLVGLLLPPKGVFGWLAGVTRYATHGQYEGEAYIGHGAILILVLCAAFMPRTIAAHVRRYGVYVATLLAFAVYAASNVVYLGSIHLITYPLPQFALDLGSYFRATGRFIWPLAYSLMILPVACLFRWWHPAAAIAAATLAVSLQVRDAEPGMRWRRQLTGKFYEDLIDTPRMNAWLAAHHRVWQYPSWSCGGLAGSQRTWAGPVANLELQVQLAAARAGKPTNSVYTSRLLKNCPDELSWAADPRLEDGVLYLLSKDVARDHPSLNALAHSNACVTLGWGIVCSRSWVAMSGTLPRDPAPNAQAPTPPARPPD